MIFLRLRKTVFLDYRQEHSAGGGRPVSCMAQDPAAHVSAGGTDTAHPGQGASGGSVTDFGGSLLAWYASIMTVLSYPIQGPAVPDKKEDSAPSTGAVVFMDLLSERDNLMASGLPINIMATIQSARAPLTMWLYALKWRMFEALVQANVFIVVSVVDCGAHPFAIRFLKGALRLRPVTKLMVPSWDLIVV